MASDAPFATIGAHEHAGVVNVYGSSCAMRIVQENMENTSEARQKMSSGSYHAVVSVSISPDVSLQHAVEQFEQQYIREVLALNQGRKERTAQMLGINRKTLYKKLKKYVLT